MAVQVTAAANAANFAAMHTIVKPAYASVMTLDCSLGDTFDVDMSGNLTLDFANAQDGQRIVVRLKQDGVGGRVLQLGPSVLLSDDIPVVTLSTGANKLDLLGLIYRSSFNKYQVTSYTRGF